jgi:hypothetical protein
MLSVAEEEELVGCLRVVCHPLYGGGNEGSIGWNLYRIKGLLTEVRFPSGVVIVTFCIEITSAGGTAFLAQSQNGWRRA